ncbi:ABC transporter substrate-binding protein [Microbacterium sp. SORGH_AS_0421]|uniref:ABC transporter substrate-binding protein n=1 Tax=Microbacterium sp. SORGH_AS_0421 TaxID=3041768 RepID=UPI00278DCDC0|nr:ABC transporter substrate-binding protein [Microbacterium sp. SORGH_AS_0421]MDQ1176226.1 peptide/nickel transport system substrate-binding protein [Microbacterium sp. SORGH_AS_0421]
MTLSARRSGAAVGAAVALALALTACAGGTAPADGSAHDPVVTIGLTGEPTNFDLTTTSGAAIPQVLLNNVYETLVSIDQQGELVPQLATAWTVSDDGLTYDFTLHDGVTFSDGATFTADDVKFSLERVKTDWTINQGKMALLDSVEVVSPTEARVKLTKPSNSWLYSLAGTVGIMFDTDGVADLANTPVGTGPFTITERVQGDHISLAARDDYWGGAPAMRDITLRYFADATASTNALRAGDVDMLYNMQAPDLVSQFKTDPTFQVLQGSSNGEILLGLNNRAAPFNDVRVRQAIAYGIDRQAVLDAAWAGYGELIGAMVPPTDPYYEDLNDLYPYDPDKARDLLAEAGAENLSITFKVPTRPYATAVAEVVVSQLAQIGVTAKIETLEFPAVWLDEVFTKDDYEMTVILAVEPRDILTVFNDPNYYIGYDNSKISALAAAADAGTKEEWIDGMKKVAKITAEDVASLPLFLFPNIVVADAALKGIAPNAVTESLNMTKLAWN